MSFPSAALSREESAVLCLEVLCIPDVTPVTLSWEPLSCIFGCPPKPPFRFHNSFFTAMTSGWRVVSHCCEDLLSIGFVELFRTLPAMLSGQQYSFTPLDNVRNHSPSGNEFSNIQEWTFRFRATIRDAGSAAGSLVPWRRKLHQKRNFAYAVDRFASLLRFWNDFARRHRFNRCNQLRQD